MKALNIEVRPIRPAVRTDGPVVLDVLVRILPPPPESLPDRPRLNLGLVLDRSGSMAGAKKIDYARNAAVFAVEQLLAEDRVSVTIFDDTVELIVPSTRAVDRTPIIERIRHVQPGGSTALHDGWMAGANQVREFLQQGGLNRVLLLTDGLANVGQTNPDSICSDVKTFAVAGVSTTTMGVGNDYNEDLLEAMAKSGDANYYYIESPVQLADIFQTELRGLMATTGRRVLLHVEPKQGVVVEEVLNDLERDAQGRLVLPNLIVGLPVEVLLRLRVPPQETADLAQLCAFHLSWVDARGGEKSQEAALDLPGVPEPQWNGLPADNHVRERAALQAASRLKKQASHEMDLGNAEEAMACLAACDSYLTDFDSEDVAQEREDLDEVKKRVAEGDLRGGAKMGKYQHYNRGHSKKRKRD